MNEGVAVVGWGWDLETLEERRKHAHVLLEQVVLIKSRQMEWEVTREERKWRKLNQRRNADSLS
ncbi:hypothetical protein [Deinococcus hopiensis]|uniref:Uncharacterized protein n=1 Tax=Deinococcus hopiensis KR-140 TaxID=695939 RepID=A0A1W1UDH5_9DEIO|nr:hypothetical protein [Deinococcus hopiensis]SMB79156.1 hypothetical protein SAMN00790413_05800 [Deinococcus hopiensis KR-140]